MTSDIAILPVVEHYGGRLARWKAYGWSAAFCPLPDHDDRTASAQVNEETNRVRCLACAFNYDAIALVRAIEGLGYRDARARAELLAGGSDGGVPRVPQQRRSGSLLPPRSGDRPVRRRYTPPWLHRG